MSAILPILLLALAGILSGGAYSMHKQGAARGGVVFVGLLAALALLGGILWLVPS
ncbi:hypothetical protein SAMN05421812_108249 [Asanoa hainanensis]|uniref:Uncharacterized protein n=1 Tax=Asanoa hainanensis TaxID=560556 RepID=A0A239NG42_9ACTN|nr:hypothetical protein [Asanoa hainanensis]SNT53374.1 hypothetical protein SAMN05421812_108249 [Asanoa hainanensis]